MSIGQLIVWLKALGITKGGGGGGGATAFTDLTDKGTVDLTSINTPLHNALALLAPLANAPLTGNPTATTQATSDNSTRLATTAFAQALVSSLVTNVLSLGGNLDCSANPNYPAAVAGKVYYVTVAGKIGGAAGVAVDIGDAAVCLVTNAGGTQAAVGTSWFILEHNIVGAALQSLGLSQFTAGLTSSSQLATLMNDETGSAGGGLLVFSKSPAIDAPTLTNVITHAGSDIIPSQASSTVLDFTKGKCTLALTGNATLTVSGGVADQIMQLHVSTDGTARTITWPAGTWRSVALQQAVTSTVIPANYSGYIGFVCTSTGNFDILGEPIALRSVGPSGTFATGANNTRTACLSSPCAGKIVLFSTQSESGTASYALAINGTPVTGGSNSVSSTKVDNVPTAANTIAVGDKLTIVRTSDASCVNADWSVRIAPVLA